jgi:MinD superfamily P-loop ATPase
LNRSDIGNKDLITQISDKYSTDISLEIPFDRKFAEIYSRGSLIENVELLKMLDGFSLNL